MGLGSARLCLMTQADALFACGGFRLAWADIGCPVGAQNPCLRFGLVGVCAVDCVQPLLGLMVGWLPRVGRAARPTLGCGVERRWRSGGWGHFQIKLGRTQSGGFCVLRCARNGTEAVAYSLL